MTRDDFVLAAIRYTDEHGADALTLRSLGDALGVAHTALYRHFSDKEDLVAAMTNHVIGLVAQLPVDPDASPSERIVQMAMNLRSVLVAHPNVAVVTSGVATPSKTDTAMTAAVVAELEAMGVPQSHLTVCYQTLETFVIGSQAYDLSGAPRHLEMRRQRHAHVDHPAFEAVATSTDAIEENNRATFEFGVRAIVAACAALGRDHDTTTASAAIG